MLNEFCEDLNARAVEGLIDPVIGRDVVQVGCRRTIRSTEKCSSCMPKNKNNPILLGDSGVGKTTIAKGLTLRIANGDIPLFLVVSFYS